MAKLSDPARFCTCFHLRKATRAVTQLFDETLQPIGLRVTQFTLLTAIALAETETVSHLAHRLIMDRTTVTRNLKPLEARGWIRRAPGKDRRTRAWSLTKPGRKILQRALPLWEKAQTQVVRRLTRDRWSGLMEHLSETVDRLNPY